MDFKGRSPGQHSKPWSPGRAFTRGAHGDSNPLPSTPPPPAVPSRPFRIHLPTDCLEGAVLGLNTLVRIRYQSNCIRVLNGSASACLLWVLISLSSKAVLIQRLDPGQSRGSANQGHILRSNALINALLKKLISSTMFPLRSFSALLPCKVLRAGLTAVDSCF